MLKTYQELNVFPEHMTPTGFLEIMKQEAAGNWRHTGDRPRQLLSRESPSWEPSGCCSTREGPELSMVFVFIVAEKDHLTVNNIVSFVKDLNRAKAPLHEEPIFVRDEKDGEGIEIALQWNEGYTENLYCFTNTIQNLDGGTHLVGFKAALTRTMNKYIEASGILQKLKLSLEGDDIREGLSCVISVKIRDPKFSSQTKDKLVSSHVKTWVEQVVGERLGVIDTSWQFDLDDPASAHADLADLVALLAELWCSGMPVVVYDAAAGIARNTRNQAGNAAVVDGAPTSAANPAPMSPSVWIPNTVRRATVVAPTSRVVGTPIDVVRIMAEQREQRTLFGIVG